MINKPKLNQPDVEQSTTLEPNMTIKSPIIRDGYRQYENYCPHCKIQLIILGNYCPNCGKPVNWGHSNVEATTLPYRKILIQPNLTLEEVKKEWEDDGYKFEVFNHKIEISKQITKDEINDTFTLFTKRILVFTRAEQYTANYLITLKEHQLLTKNIQSFRLGKLSMGEFLIKVISMVGYIFTLIFITAVTLAILKYTNNNQYIIGFMTICFSNWLLGSIVKIIKYIGNKRGWFDVD